MVKTSAGPIGRALLGLAGTALVLTGCASDPAPRVATYDSGGNGMDALVGGTLSITRECVTVIGPDGVHTTPAFDGGVELRDDVLVVRGRSYTDGSPIELGGGDAGDVSQVVLPEGCPSDHVFLVAPRG